MPNKDLTVPTSIHAACCKTCGTQLWWVLCFTYREEPNRLFPHYEGLLFWREDKASIELLPDDSDDDSEYEDHADIVCPTCRVFYEPEEVKEFLEVPLHARYQAENPDSGKDPWNDSF